MGYTNGTVSFKSDKRPQREKGFSLTADNNFHLQNKRLTNVSAPINDHDATTKKFVADLLKTKAGTTYVNNELAKKANSSALKHYALITDLGTLAIEFNGALKDKVDYNDLAFYTQTQADFKPKEYITIYAEENGSLIENALQYSFGNGTEQYGWPSPVDGKIIRGSICACAGNRQAAELKARLALNGNDRGDRDRGDRGDVNIIKPACMVKSHYLQ